MFNFSLVLLLTLINSILCIVHKVSLSQAKYNYTTEYIEQPVDHFNFGINDTFKMRYLINDVYWAPDKGPIFFYTGNEGDITLFAQNTGFMWETAPEFNALLVFAEHRYYGESMPYGNTSYSDAKHRAYLTAEQALADYVNLIAHLRTHKEPGRKKHNPVIAFGGSYGGMLAAWIRMKYPASVTGSLAASAPIWQFEGLTDCNIFNKITTSVYKVSGKNCAHNIRQTWKEMDILLKTDEGKSWISSNWTLCKPLKEDKDIKTLKDWLGEFLVDITMANYPYPASFLGSLPAYPVKEFCKHIGTKILKDKELLGAVSHSLQALQNFTGTVKCYEWQQQSTPGLDVSGWDYQACSQMIMPMCSDGANDMFEPEPWNLTDYVNNCKNEYGIIPRPYFIEKEYGGKHIETATNIIFSNGLLDPWTGGGVIKDISRSAIAVLIPEGAHHLDLRESNPQDPKGVVLARTYYRQIFNKWINNNK